MAEFRWIITSSFLMLQVFDCRAAVGGYSSITVRDGDEATLSCKHELHRLSNCKNTTWSFFRSETVTLIEFGQFSKEAKDKSDRLSLTEECSLVIKNVTKVDVGRYTCRYLGSGPQHAPKSVLLLTVVTMTKQTEGDAVTFICSVSTNYGCGHTVELFYDADEKYVLTKSSCSANVTFPTSQYDEVLKCKVTEDDTGKVHLFTFSRPQPSVWWRWWILLSVGVAALFIIPVAVIIWKRTKANKRQPEDNVADPEEGVSYASVSYNKKTSSKAQAGVLHRDDGDGDAVTYSTLKAPPSSAAAAADPRDFYATVNKPCK